MIDLDQRARELNEAFLDKLISYKSENGLSYFDLAVAVGMSDAWLHSVIKQRRFVKSEIYFKFMILMGEME